MTIRGYLLLRYSLARVACVLACVGAALVLFALVNPAKHPYSLYAIVAIGLAMLPMQAWIRARIVRCPRCKVSLGSRSLASLPSCPKCGVSFGEEVS
jgi:hypothetical protein